MCEEEAANVDRKLDPREVLAAAENLDRGATFAAHGRVSTRLGARNPINEMGPCTFVAPLQRVAPVVLSRCGARYTRCAPKWSGW